VAFKVHAYHKIMTIKTPLSTYLLRLSFAMSLMSSPQTFAISGIEVRSRNMPANCQYVYRVESDINIKLPENENTPAGQGIKMLRWKMNYRFVDAYNESNTHIDEASLDAEAGTTGPEWHLSLLSFDTTVHRLLRKIIFDFEVLDSQGVKMIRLPSEDPRQFYISEFGREFGEHCSAYGREGTPFRPREVQLYVDYN